ncbi:MAG: ABC transporter ATP-binding protein [Actinomycetota bacterium]|nr:ABC transporter ATP-binding protein [Actinomycetota bacterium]
MRLERVGVHFRTNAGMVEALRGITLEIGSGDFLSLLGPTGCGKSTLLRVIADLVPLSAGSATVLGVAPSVARKARSFGFVFQDAALMPWRRVIDNVLLPIELAGGVGAAAREAAEEALELVGLQERKRAYPKELSGGMKQRVSIARALVTKPRILLMDEPFGALDEITRDRLNEELLNIWKATGTTTVFVTHSIPEAAFLSQRVAVLTPGPGRIREIVDVTLPYPRGREIRDTVPFLTTTSRLRGLLAGADAT